MANGGHPCCNLVGNFPIEPLEGIISVSSRGGTEMMKVGDNILKGATTGSISVTAYASDELHKGCVGRAGVSINWIRKYDCDNDLVYYIFAGEGKSYKVGDVGNLIELHYPDDVVIYETINASASSGPVSLYQIENQIDSYGLSYNGKPWPFSTKSDGEILMELGPLQAGYGRIFLQSFSLNATPGQLPTVTYDFVYTVSEGDQ